MYLFAAWIEKFTYARTSPCNRQLNILFASVTPGMPDGILLQSSATSD